MYKKYVDFYPFSILNNNYVSLALTDENNELFDG